MTISQHKSVLLEEVIKHISPASPNVYVDATVGSGGHAERILKESSPKGRLIGIDVDPYMLLVAEERLRKFSGRYNLVKDNYISLAEILSKLDVTEVSGMVFDLGVATEHFMLPERGFSFSKEGPLDMRLDPNGKLTAEDIINEWRPEDLINILYQYGEERHARKIVRYIIAERNKRRITGTAQLAEIIVRALRYRRKIHPATKVFQALRIAVNDELKNIKEVLPAAVDLLKTGGRLCVISFHSLEDRLVKDIFRSLAKLCICPPEFPKCICGALPKVKIITKRPVVPGEEEIASNPRARSAKLRVVERI